MNTLGVIISTAALIAMSSAAFGVGTARLIWSEDLKQAQKIDAIRSETEEHLLNTISNQRVTIEALNKRLELVQLK